MSAPSRRKAKKRFVTFTLTVEAQEMIVQYQADWMPDMGHFEFRSPHEPPRRIPLSETGYSERYYRLRALCKVGMTIPPRGP
jgi:hypothetical protein